MGVKWLTRRCRFFGHKAENANYPSRGVLVMADAMERA
jgi:hypothetical protein